MFALAEAAYRNIIDNDENQVRMINAYGHSGQLPESSQFHVGVCMIRFGFRFPIWIEIIDERLSVNHNHTFTEAPFLEY